MNNKDFYLNLINDCLKTNYIDLTELGAEYFFLQPDTCDYCIGSPTEQARWHINHINKCLDDSEIGDFSHQLISFIQKKGEEFRNKKERVVKKIKEAVGLEDWEISKKVGNEPILYCYHDIGNCLNSEQLVQKEQEWMEIAKKVKQSQENEDQSRKEREEEWKKQKTENDKFWQEWRVEREKMGGKIYLGSLILDASDLATLEKNYQTVKNNSFYGSDKVRLDDFYATQKRLLEQKAKNEKEQKQDNDRKEEEEEKCPKYSYICYGKYHDGNHEIKKNSQQSIQKAFSESGINPNELNKSLWNSMESWEKYLEKLKDEESIIRFENKLKQSIKEKLEQKKRRSQQEKEKSNNSSPANVGKIVAIGAVILVLLAICSYFIWQKKKRVR